jgi:hypothetical protein
MDKPNQRLFDLEFYVNLQVRVWFVKQVGREALP